MRRTIFIAATLAGIASAYAADDRRFGLLDGELKPTRGKKETTDHPPIYPTQAIHPGALGDGPKKRV